MGNIVNTTISSGEDEAVQHKEENVSPSETGGVKTDLGTPDGKTSGFEPEKLNNTTEAALDEMRPEMDEVVDFMVVLDKEPLLDKFTSKEIRQMGEEVVSYKESLEAAIENVKAKLEDAFGQEADFEIGNHHTISTVAISVKSRYGNQEAMEAMEQVAQAYVAPNFQLDAREHDLKPLTENVPGMIGAGDVNASGFTGKGMKIAIIDTGIVLEHPSFQPMEEDKITSTSLTEEFVENIWSMTNAGNRLYSLTEDPDVPVTAIDILGDGIDINGLAIKVGKKFIFIS